MDWSIVIKKAKKGVIIGVGVGGVLFTVGMIFVIYAYSQLFGQAQAELIFLLPIFFGPIIVGVPLAVGALIGGVVGTIKGLAKSDK